MALWQIGRFWDSMMAVSKLSFTAFGSQSIPTAFRLHSWDFDDFHPGFGEEEPYYFYFSATASEWVETTLSMVFLRWWFYLVSRFSWGSQWKKGMTIDTKPQADQSNLRYCCAILGACWFWRYRLDMKCEARLVNCSIAVFHEMWIQEIKHVVGQTKWFTMFVGILVIENQSSGWSPNTAVDSD